MPPSKSAAPTEQPAATLLDGPSPLVVLSVAWLVPGAGHFLVRHSNKGVVFFVAIVAMFALGLSFGGRLFPYQAGDLLVLLAAVAEWGAGGPRAIGLLAGFGDGQVTAVTYEYGNAFLISSGLLNALVALDAFDIASGRKA